MTIVASEQFDEVFEGITEDRVDEERGIVKGVKLLGLKSKNRRNYATAGVRRTAPAFLEGASIYIDHPDMSAVRKPRSYRDKFGQVIPGTVTFLEGKGFYGDIRYNVKHPLASQFAFDVKTSPKTLGMSINGDFRSGGTDSSGDVLVEEIVGLRSVDIVTSPATTQGMFEHHQEEEEIMDLKTLREKHPELVKQVLESEGAKDDSQKALEALQAQNRELAEKLDKIEKEKAQALLRDEVTGEIKKAFEGVDVPEDAIGLLVECACKLEDRKPIVEFASKISPLLKVVTDSEADETQEDPITRESADDKAKPGSSKALESAGGYTPKAGSKSKEKTSEYSAANLLKTLGKS